MEFSEKIVDQFKLGPVYLGMVSCSEGSRIKEKLPYCGKLDADWVMGGFLAVLDPFQRPPVQSSVRA